MTFIQDTILAVFWSLGYEGFMYIGYVIGF